MSNIFNQVTSLAKAIAAQVAAGMPMASKEEQLERHATCQSNECKKFNKEEYRCGICNCYLELKIPLGTSECPIGLWGKSTGDNNE